MQAKPKDWPQTRMEMAGGAADMPPVPDAAAHMIEGFADLGMVQSNGMGLGPLPYSEIAAGLPWADHSERRVIREMSRAYLAGVRIGEDPFGIAPFSSLET